MFKIVLLLIFITLPVRGFSAISEKDAAQIHAYLDGLKMIRVAMVDGAGNGHQAIAVTIIKNLRMLGYSGQIELVFEKREKKKLEFLLPPFLAEGPDEQLIPSLNVQTRSYTDEHGRLGSFTLAPLTIVSSPNGRFHEPQFFNSRRVIYFTPPHWGRNPLLIQDQRLPLKSVRDSYPLGFNRDNIADVPAFFARQMSASPRLAPKINGLNNLISLNRAGESALLTAYGLGIGGVNRLTTLVRALRRAQRLDRSFPKSIAIGLISNLNAEEWSQLERNLHPIKFRSVDSEDSAALEGGLPRGVSLVKIGNVTQDVWHFLMRESRLAPLAAGSNGVDFLFHRGRPFVITDSKSSAVFGFDGHLEEDQDHHFVETFLDKDLRAIHEALDHQNDETLARFYISSFHPQTEINQRFARFAELTARQPDRLCATLIAAEEMPAMELRLKKVLDWLSEHAGPPAP